MKNGSNNKYISRTNHGKRALTDEQIYQEIYDAIVELRLAPGAKLGQDELGEIFGVSKTRIRPILHQLAQQKIVTIQSMRGAFVAKPSVDEARAVNSARQIIEEGVVRAATRKITAKQIKELEKNVTEEKEARVNDNIGQAHRLSGKFHLKLAEIAGNQVVVDIVNDLISRDSLVVALYQKPSVGAGVCSVRGHIALIKCISSGDEDAATTCMREHLEEVMASLHLDDVPDDQMSLRQVFSKIS